MALVPTVRTPITAAVYARGVVGAWHHVERGLPSEGAVAVLFSQFMTETSGRKCWNWNVGNVKHVPGDGYDHCVLQGVWEGVSPANAERMIRAGIAVPDPSPEHARAVGPGRVSVILTPQNPGSWFRAYDSLEHAMRSHLKFLSGVYGGAWPKVLAGDPVGFAYALRARGYFTASAEAYAALMRPAFDAFVRSTAYEDAIAAVVPSPATIYLGKVAAPNGLNLRAEASASSARRAHVPRGAVLQVVRELAGAKIESGSPGAGGWLEVFYGGTRGYVLREWVVPASGQSTARELPELRGMVELEHAGERFLVAPVQIAPIGIGAAAELAEALGCELPTPELVEAIWRAADCKIDSAEIERAASGHDGTPATMDSPEMHARVAARLGELVGPRSLGIDFRLQAGAFKDVVRAGGELGLYGWHNASGRPRQPIYTGHVPSWRDYSQGVRLVRRITAARDVDTARELPSS